MIAKVIGFRPSPALRIAAEALAAAQGIAVGELARRALVRVVQDEQGLLTRKLTLLTDASRPGLSLAAELWAELEAGAVPTGNLSAAGAAMLWGPSC